MKFPLIRMLVWDKSQAVSAGQGNAIPIPTGIPEGIKIGNDLLDSILTQKWEK